jgi:hypothetical protein
LALLALGGSVASLPPWFAAGTPLDAVLARLHDDGPSEAYSTLQTFSWTATTSILDVPCWVHSLAIEFSAATLFTLSTIVLCAIVGHLDPSNSAPSLLQSHSNDENAARVDRRNGLRIAESGAPQTLAPLLHFAPELVMA